MCGFNNFSSYCFCILVVMLIYYYPDFIYLLWTTKQYIGEMESIILSFYFFPKEYLGFQKWTKINVHF